MILVCGIAIGKADENNCCKDKVNIGNYIFGMIKL